MKNKNEEYYEIDVSRIFKTLWSKIWILMITGFIFAAVGFALAAYVVAPKYSSSVMLYVNNMSKNNNTSTDPSFTMSSSQIMAAQSLVKTYAVILNNRTTLDEVALVAGVDYSASELAGMIEAAPVNETEVMLVTVTTHNAEEARDIANAVCEVLPKRINVILDGATMEVVDRAVANYNKVSPSKAVYTALGMFLGLFASAAVLTVRTLLDDRIHDEEYLLSNYDTPVLAKIPDLVNAKSKKGRNYYYYKNNYYYKHRSQSSEETK